MSLSGNMLFCSPFFTAEAGVSRVRCASASGRVNADADRILYSGKSNPGRLPADLSCGTDGPAALGAKRTRVTGFAVSECVDIRKMKPGSRTASFFVVLLANKKSYEFNRSNLSACGLQVSYAARDVRDDGELSGCSSSRREPGGCGIAGRRRNAEAPAGSGAAAGLSVSFAVRGAAAGWT